MWLIVCKKISSHEPFTANLINPLIDDQKQDGSITCAIVETKLFMVAAPTDIRLSSLALCNILTI